MMSFRLAVVLTFNGFLILSTSPVFAQITNEEEEASSFFRFFDKKEYPYTLHQKK